MSAIEISVIVPFVDEGSNVIFTTQGLIEELDGFCKYEIILVDNMSHNNLVTKAGNREYPTYSRDYFFHPPKKATPEQIADKNCWEKIGTMFFRKGIVKYFTYDAKQGHWNAKNHGIANSKGKYLFFLDAHCLMKRDSVRKMIQFLRETEGKTVDGRYPGGTKVGGVHAYINYILDSRCLEYKVQRKTFGYQFCTHQVDEYFLDNQKKEVEVSEEIRLVTRAAANPPDPRKEETWESRYGSNPIIKPYILPNEKGIRLDPSWPKRLTRFKQNPYPVCVMSTCAMMCPRSVIDELGPWHPEFGIYGGGESYMNWKQSTCGYSHWIHPEAWCWHFADKRGYSWNQSDFVRNSFIAAYMVGGEEFLSQQVGERLKKDRPEVINALADDVRNKCKAERDFIQSKQVVSFEDYITYWEQHPGIWK